MKTPSNNYRRYVLLMLMGVYAFNFIDRQLLVILQESIKADLGLSDTQLGLLTGFSFALFYVTLGLPIARLADKYNRVNIVAISLTVWSGVTALSGLVSNFVQLLLARIGVGIGEAGGSPPSHAIISDYYPPEKRATALSIYSLGIYIGIFIGYLGGGLIDQYYGWRTAFFALGIPGVLLAALLYFTVKEPLRGRLDTIKKKTEAHSIKEVIIYLFAKKSFVYLALGAGFTAFISYGLGNWFPPFLARYHGMSSQEIGISNALIVGIGGAIGTFGGGYLADKYGRINKKLYMLFPFFGVLLALPFSVGALFFTETKMALYSFFPAVILNALYLAPCIAMAHNLVPANMRAFASSVLFFVLNIIGLGGGPLIAGVLSDRYIEAFGDQALRYSLATILISGIIAAAFFYGASRSLEKDLEPVN